MIKDAILQLAKKEDISYDLAKESMNEIMGGKATDVQMSAYLTALSMKGETIDEITASAEAMRSHCIKLLNDCEVLEIVGTGGDGSNSFNISTTSSIVISSAGVPVAKHGNRAASSKSGAADVLESLGVNINVSAEQSAQILRKINLCFLFAQNYHIAMKYVAPIRKELGIPTIFNILGPLANPAGASMQVMGVYDESLVRPLTKVLHNLGVKKALVVFGQDKLDEISVSSPTTVCEIKDDDIIEYVIKPEDFGFERCSKDDLVGGDPDFNAKITQSILDGEKGPKRNAVVINSAAGLYVAGKVSSLKEGVVMAEELIDTGVAKKQLEQFIKLSNKIDN
ncbi:MAG: anthranilate phosphoribosyltransferase [Methanobacteriaceae archaeon]|nr:anthranilate phosphoribosyltransferase [Methanobacteriaceae archaeon]